MGIKQNTKHQMINKFTATAAIAGLFAHVNAVSIKQEGSDIFPPGTDGTNYPDATNPDTTNPDTTNPDTTNPDTTNPDTTNPDENPDTNPVEDPEEDQEEEQDEEEE